SYSRFTVLGSISTSTARTPGRDETAPSMLSLQWAHEMSGTVSVVVVMSELLFDRRRPRNRGGVLHRLHQLVDDFGCPPFGNGRSDTRLQVVLQQDPIDFLQGRLQRRDLLHDVRAVPLVLDHSEDGIQMTAHGLQPVD